MTRAEEIEKAALVIRGGPEGCITQPNCGNCSWCNLDKALALPSDEDKSVIRDELERYTVKVATTMSTVAHRTVMEYILPKAKHGWIEVPEVEYPLMMADSFKVLDSPEVQERMEKLLMKLDEPPRYRRGMQRLVGNARCNECLTHKPALTCFDCDPDGSCGWMVCDECLQGALR